MAILRKSLIRSRFGDFFFLHRSKKGINLAQLCLDTVLEHEAISALYYYTKIFMRMSEIYQQVLRFELANLRLEATSVRRGYQFFSENFSGWLNENMDDVHWSIRLRRLLSKLKLIINFGGPPSRPKPDKI